MNTCAICDDQFEQPPCSARPIKDDALCCPRCDDLVVTPLRILVARRLVNPKAAVDIFRGAAEIHKAAKKLLEEAYSISWHCGRCGFINRSNAATCRKCTVPR